MSEQDHVVVIHRWRAEYVDYAAVLDHTAHRVSYVTTEVGLPRVPAPAAGVEIVAKTDDLEEVRRAVSRLAERHGPPRRIVALKEDDLLTAATLRDEWGCEGTKPDQALRFLDKLVMAEVVASRGLAVPPLTAVDSAEDVREFAAEHGWPVIVKPRIGSSSDGVARLDGPYDAKEIDFAARPMLAQVFNPHPIYHVDGVYLDGRLVAFRASRYVNNCLGFRTGDHLGSVEEDDPAIVSAIGAAAERFVGAFDTDPLVFHLELFVAPAAATGAPECTFLEVGARVGGSEIPFLWREVHGYDLMAAALRLQLGEPLEKPVLKDDGVAGWLLVPSPARRPCRITEVTPLSGRVPGLYAEALLDPGEVLPLADAYYEHVGGRFRFRGPTSRTVEDAIRIAAADFRISAEPVGDIA
ncbi:acetyl-CoA carboxylase biotin carboxylase subunit family protein [Streptomyces sp. RK62]|uniref:ATP-grasp domain-containing protein n=1 Tax=Streptomyces sp. RK62 TaxID=2824893 RepID=UPI001B362453|nr:biotin carboxylase [Streptomyces sp. RK62]MBQ1000086.1 biotin carboxylase [Streptomyces sp. RK62]